MRTEWLIKKGNRRLVLFFNGWGMDAQAVAHLGGACDVWMAYDYRVLESVDLPDVRAYGEVCVVAWSMGVWAAANVVPQLPVAPGRAVALNGTEHPVDDRWGIPERVYRLTERGMNAAGREKFVGRMLADAAEAERFAESKPARSLEEVCGELTAIREQSAVRREEMKWHKAYVSEQDVIFPAASQRAWWQGRAERVCGLAGGHYPFYRFGSWDEIIDDENEGNH